MDRSLQVLGSVEWCGAIQGTYLGVGKETAVLLLGDADDLQVWLVTDRSYLRDPKSPFGGGGVETVRQSVSKLFWPLRRGKEGFSRPTSWVWGFGCGKIK